MKDNAKYIAALFAIVLTIYIPAFFLLRNYSQFGADKDFPITRGDTEDYVSAANNMRDHRTFSIATEAPFAPDTLRTPGYPLFLWAATSVFGSYIFVSILQILLTALNCCILFLMIQKFIPKKWALGASLLYLLDPNVMWFSFIVMADTLFVSLVLLAVYILFFSDKFSPIYKNIIAGALIGGAILVKPIAILLPFILPLFYIWFERGKISVKAIAIGAGLFVVSCMLILAPWLIRNKIAQGEWGISSAGAPGLLFCNVAEFLSASRHKDLVLVRSELEKEARISGSSWRDLENWTLKRSQEFNALAKKYILGDPLGYAKFHLIKNLPVFLMSGFEDARINLAHLTGVAYEPETAKLNYSDLVASGNFRAFFSAVIKDAFVLEKFFWFLVFCGALAGAWLMRKEKLVWLMLLLMFYFMLPLPYAHVRYRLPIEPFLLTLASIGLFQITGALMRKRSSASA